MKYGYARVSTSEQDTQLQCDALNAAGCSTIYKEIASGGKFERIELHKLLDIITRCDIVVVYKLDRLSRSLKDLLTILQQLADKGGQFISLTENIDTTTAAGRMLMQIIGAFSEYERNMIVERTNAGLAAARAQGRVGGNRHKLSYAQREEVKKMVAEGRGAQELAVLFNVSRWAIYRVLKV